MDARSPRSDPPRPVVRVVDPRRPAPVAGAPRRAEGPTARRGVLALGVGAAALLLVLGAVDLHRAQVQARSAAVRAADLAALRLDVVGARPAQAVPVQGAPVQDAPVELLVRNDGPVPVRLVQSRLDDSPLSPAAGTAVPPGAIGVLATVWRVRCQEVGGLTGPSALEVGVELADGGVVPYLVDLQPVTFPAGPARAYRVAALRSCITLEAS